MSKITVRADDELVAQLEAREESKSQLVRDALRQYLAADATAAGVECDRSRDTRGPTTLDDFLDARVEELVEARLDELIEARVDDVLTRRQQDVNVTVNLSDERVSDTDDKRVSDAVSDDPAATQSPDAHDTACTQCGESLDEGHVYCPNCGEKASRRAFCDCGDEVRSDWAFCPSCGRRTPAADVLDSPSDGRSP
ncbi:double zinc ribbon domain-containing protein [Haloarchaeobius sp. DFWS5]|uniref:double zinc ribbon domain-containing protein n=1 Tax=Haloarchaeobius sp. DFWS5 TaxID=3446114 RepID=UPI003EB96ACA